MGRKSSIPEDILEHVPCKCCRVRNDGDGVYRVYKYSAIKLPSGKWSSDYGYLIGKILSEKGFIPNKRYLKELSEQGTVVFSDGITDVAYGQYALLSYLSRDVLEKLEACFPVERAAQIYAYALIMCANGFIHIDQIDDFYQESFLSVLYRNYAFKMGYTALTHLLRDLGMRGNPVKEFEQSLIDGGSKNIAIDGHVIRSCSAENDLAEPGYKMNLLKAPQVNLLIAFDIKNKMPLMYRTYRGSSVDKSSVLEFLRSRSFTDTKFIVDRGFYSDPVLSLMSENGNCYIIPLPSNNSHFRRIKKTLAYTSGEFVYRSGKKDCARIVYYEERIDEKTRIIVYKDEDENNSKRKSYKQMIDLGENNYTQEKYEKYCDWWGVYFLQTTTDGTAPDVYSDYKGRWSIETFNNYIKNDADFNGLKIQDYYVDHGFDFIMLVTGLIHARLNEAVKTIQKPSISTFDVLIKSGHMRMVLEENEWTLHNTRTKDLELLKAMGFVPEKTYPAAPSSK
ncbi:MAG: transposase [Eubacteriales bacterium]|nr:transposase [Eubacteriales bacterium]